MGHATSSRSTRPRCAAAFEKFEELWSADGNVVGGTQGILAIGFGDSPTDLFTDPPGCFMHRQGNFITGFFPDEVQEDLDANVGVAYFPPVEGGYDGNPVLAGGDLAMLLNDTPAARAVMEFLATDTFGEPWAQAGGWLSPHIGLRRQRLPDRGRAQPVRDRRRAPTSCASTPPT